MRSRFLPRWLRTALIVALAPGFAAAEPPKGDWVTFSVTVTNESGAPLEGAAVWVMYDTIARTDLRAADLARLVARYGRDVDLVFDGELHPDMRTLYTDSRGQATVNLYELDVGALKRVRGHFAAFKRGFMPTQVSDETPKNTDRTLQIRLALDPAAKVEPRMLELDRIHSKARVIASGPVSLAQGVALKAADGEIRALAAELENNGLADEAAAAYFVLANLPSVDTAKDSQGNPIIIGVTNNFRGNDKRRRADLEKAATLQRSFPALEFEQFWMQLAIRDLEPLAFGVAPLRTEYVKGVQALLARHGERLWPATRYYLWRALIREKEYSAACDVLRSFQQSEPSYFNRQKWQKASKQYRDDVQTAGGPVDAHCDLALPKS